MIWIAISLLFFWMVYRELTNPLMELSEFGVFEIGYVITLLALAFAAAWPPFSTWRLEQRLVRVATVLADQKKVSVHCNTIFDSIFDNELRVAGHANPLTGEIVFQYSWCRKLVDYLAAPESASDELNWSMSVLVHEAMHIRGELNESKTECQAIQRRVRAEIMLGVPKAIALKNTEYFYQNLYFNRHPYFTPDCQRGGALDERLDDWQLPILSVANSRPNA
jgi:hypothetical protein